MRGRHQITDELLDWADVQDAYLGASLLLGNGASIALCRDFRYNSLYNEAPLSQLDVKIFEAAETTNFEIVLDDLRISEIVCAAMGHRSKDVRDRYRSTQSALLAAIRKVHPQWAQVPTNVLKSIERILNGYETVYSTNYDLIVYWSIMARAHPRIRDYFWSDDDSFDATNIGLWGNKSDVLYLHGGLHLCMDTRTGRTIKRNSAAGNLLDFDDTDSTIRPLFVSEGRSADKMRSIRRSDYLSFAYENLAHDSRPIVIFGHSLSGFDLHITEAIGSTKRRIAVALMPADGERIISEKARIGQCLASKTIKFFDARSHPLGSTEFNIDD